MSILTNPTVGQPASSSRRSTVVTGTVMVGASTSAPATKPYGPACRKRTDPDASPTAVPITRSPVKSLCAALARSNAALRGDASTASTSQPSAAA